MFLYPEKVEQVKGKLGNQYFLKTLAKCKLNGRDVDRYLYIDNV